LNSSAWQQAVALCRALCIMGAAKSMPCSCDDLNPRVRRVRSLGKRDWKNAIEERIEDFAAYTALAEPYFRRTVLKCPIGHTMKAHVVREMFNLCNMPKNCAKCDVFLDSKVSYYVCRQCDIVYCNACARLELKLPKALEKRSLLDIMPGDMFLAGPDKYGIHHVILARSRWRAIEPEVAEALRQDFDPGTEILACDTIESTQGSVGDTTWWYSATTYFARDPCTGAASLIADLPANSFEIEQVVTPVPTKVLLHPFRGHGCGPRLDTQAFESVIADAALNSKCYGKLTAVQSAVNGLMRREVISSSEYTTEDARRELLGKLRKSWRARPICASVAVMCWQQYLFCISPTDDEAVQNIVRYMPCWCHRSTPCALVSKLSQLGWIMSDYFHS